MSAPGSARRVSCRLWQRLEVGDEASGEAAPERTRLRFAGLVEVAVWLGAVGMVVLVATVLIGLDRPSPVLAAQGMVPWLLTPAYPLAAWALWRRRRVLSVLALVAVAAHLPLTLPAATADAEPSWVGNPTTSRFRVLVANVQFDNTRWRQAADVIGRTDADVVIVNEATERFVAELDRNDNDRRLPTRHFVGDTVFGTLVLTRLAATSRPLPGI